MAAFELPMSGSADGRYVLKRATVPTCLVEIGLGVDGLVQVDIVVDGGRSTGSLGIKDDLVNAGSTWVDEPAFRDGAIVWGRVVEDIPDFCRELVAAIETG